MDASDHRYSRRPIFDAQGGNTNLVLQLVSLIIGLPIVIVAIAMASGPHWLGAMIGAAVVLVVVFLILTVISLLRS